MPRAGVVVDAAGGRCGRQGKTRLARHLAAQLAGDGWAAVVLAEQVGAADIAVLAEVATPTLVIVDYAEGRTHQLDALIQAMNRAETKVRLLLLARTAGAWRTERTNPSPHLAELGDDRIVLDLSPVEPTTAGREQAWQQAAAALAPHLADLAGYRHIAWPTVAEDLAAPRLDGDRYRTILAVQMHALAALLQAGDRVPDATPAAGGPPNAQEVLLAHENRYWSRVADRFGITLTPATRRCLVATATLWGAAEADDARRVLTTTLPGADPDTLANVVDWLATLYRDSERYWSGLQPDPLAEYLIGTALGPDGRCPTLVTDTITGVSPGQLEHGMTVLGRAHPQHPHLTRTITDTVLNAGTTGGAAAIAVVPRLDQPQPLLTALDRLIDIADAATLRALSDALPRFSMLLTPTSLRTAATLVDLYRELAAGNRDAYLPNLAMSVNNLALRLAETGRRAEALDCAREASAHYHELSRTNPDAFRPAAERADSFVAALVENEL